MVTVFDVGPRDGLQNEPEVIAPEVRAELVGKIVAAGVRAVEVASFVDPRRVPQMAGAEEVVAALGRESGVVYAGLALNERGYDRLVACGLDEVRFSFGATESFNQRNQNASVRESLDAALRIVERGRADGIRSAVTISVAFGCPFEGPVDESRVLELAEEISAARPDTILLADTIGVGVPGQVRRLVSRAVGLGVPIGGHFHNTRNTGYANALAALEAGATVLDASVGGLGGCPFAPRATGNIATEDLVYLLHGEGVDTGIDLDALTGVSEWLEGFSAGGSRASSTAPEPIRRRRRTGGAGRIVPATSPSSTSPARPRSTTVSPSSRNVLVLPSPSMIGCAPLRVSSISEPSLPGSGPEIVPDANRSPVRSDAPFTVACASCCGIVQ